MDGGSQPVSSRKNLAGVLRELYEHASDLSVQSLEEQSVRGHVGWLLGIQQGGEECTAKLLAPDHFIRAVGGVPLHTLLLALPPMESEVIKTDDSVVYSPGVLLVRPIGTLDDIQRSAADTLFQHYRNQPELGPLLPQKEAQGIFGRGLDPYTKSMHSFGGYVCQVLGTLYTKSKSGELCFSPDLEYLPSDCNYTVVKPGNRMMNQVLREIRSCPDLSASVRLGSVQYSATQNLQPLSVKGSHDCPEGLVAEMSLDEILARRTALFGMTRTGKSNTIKVIAANLAIRCPHVGQIIFDINGEYAHENEKDGGSLSKVLKATHRVDVLGTEEVPGHSRMSLLPNFYIDMNLGLSLIFGSIESKPSSEAFNTLAKMRFVEFPDEELEEWMDPGFECLKVLLFRCLLWSARYQGMDVEQILEETYRQWASFVKGSGAGSLVKHIKSLSQCRDVNQLGETLRIDPNPEISALAQLICGRNAGKREGTPIVGKGLLRASFGQHSPCGPERGLGRYLCEALDAGRLVVLDLSLTKPSAQSQLMEYIASFLFKEATHRFINSLKESGEERSVCSWMIYIEEAHNLIGREARPDDPWPRLAKEAGKMGVGMVFATQEPSSIQTNIMSNTENLLVSHLNNKREVKEVSGYNDLETFSRSILNIRSPGYVRLRQRDLPFTLPVQIDRFSVQWVEEMLSEHGQEIPQQSTPKEVEKSVSPESVKPSHQTISRPPRVASTRPAPLLQRPRPLGDN